MQAQTNTMLHIGIYCSASTHIDPLFRDSAIKLATWMGQQHLTLINGGSNQGLMAIMSRTIQEQGGHSIGVIPKNFKARGWFSPYTDETVFVDDLSERKDVIKERSDVLVAFPGGIGTLDEFFDAWASFNLGFHDKPILLVNINGFYDPLITFLDSLKTARFTHDFLPNPLTIVHSVDACIDYLSERMTRPA